MLSFIRHLKLQLKIKLKYFQPISVCLWLIAYKPRVNSRLQLVVKLTTICSPLCFMGCGGSSYLHYPLHLWKNVTSTLFFYDSLIGSDSSWYSTRCNLPARYKAFRYLYTRSKNRNSKHFDKWGLRHATVLLQEEGQPQVSSANVYNGVWHYYRNWKMKESAEMPRARLNRDGRLFLKLRG